MGSSLSRSWNTAYNPSGLARRDSQLLELRDSVLEPPLTLQQAWRRCADHPGEVTAWERLLDRIYPLLRRIAQRVASRWGAHQADEIDDLVQDICLKISQQVRSIAARMPADDVAAELYSKAVAANAAQDTMRSRHAAKRDVSVTVKLEDHVELLKESLGGVALERTILFRQVDELLEGSARDRSVFWLYYRQGLTAKEIAAIPALQLTNKGVESLLYRMTNAVRQRIRNDPEAAT